MEEVKIKWNGDVLKVRVAMTKFEENFGGKLVFPVYFRNKEMFLPKNTKVDDGSEIYFYIDDVPIMEIAMPVCGKNLTVNLLNGEMYE